MPCLQRVCHPPPSFPKQRHLLCPHRIETEGAFSHPASPCLALAIAPKPTPKENMHEAPRTSTSSFRLGGASRVRSGSRTARRLRRLLPRFSNQVEFRRAWRPAWLQSSSLRHDGGRDQLRFRASLHGRVYKSYDWHSDPAALQPSYSSRTFWTKDRRRSRFPSPFSYYQGRLR